MVREWGTGEGTDTARWYRGFAVEVRDQSTAYERLADGVAADPELLARLDDLPRPKRQPNLLLAATRFHRGPVDDYPAFRTWALRNWPLLSATMRARRTQTNEVGRCAALLPVLARLPQPLALIEVGASAGLCLYPDRYRYRYDDRPAIGPAASSVELACQTAGPVPLPAHPPAVAWRAGVDLNPLDVTDPDDMRWLECLVWPGPAEADRLHRLRAAVRVARAAPPELVRGDLNAAVADLVACAPAGTTPVVLHSAVLAYLTAEERAAFSRTVRGLAGHWVANEGAAVLPEVERRLPPHTPRRRGDFVISLDGHPVARADPHGRHLAWLDPPIVG